MNFISLHDLMDKRADEIQPPRYSDPDFAIEARYSEAAATFHQALLNASGSRPRWFKIHDKTRLPTINEEAATEGLRILEHMAGAFSRRVRARNNHIRDCINGGLDPATVMMGYNLNDFMYRGPDMFLAQEIGFDYKEIMEFFNSTVNTELQVDECPDCVQGQSQVKANAAKPGGGDSLDKNLTAREIKVAKRIEAFQAAIRDKKIDLEHDTLNKMHITLKGLDSELWPPTHDGFKDWKERYLPDLKLKRGRKPQHIR